MVKRYSLQHHAEGAHHLRLDDTGSLVGYADYADLAERCERLEGALRQAEIALRQYEVKIDWEWGDCTQRLEDEDGWGDEIMLARELLSGSSGGKDG